MKENRKLKRINRKLKEENKFLSLSVNTLTQFVIDTERRIEILKLEMHENDKHLPGGFWPDCCEEVFCRLYDV